MIFIKLTVFSGREAHTEIDPLPYIRRHSGLHTVYLTGFFFLKFLISREYFVNNRTGELMQQGDVYTMPKLGQTLRIIANEGANALYDGQLTSRFTEEIRNAGGIVTDKDLTDYP